VERWDPEQNPRHQRIKARLTITTQASNQSTAEVSTTAPATAPALILYSIVFGICLAAELASGTAVAQEYGLVGIPGLLTGLIIGSSIFYLLHEVQRP
jgi:hydrogenase/urease accessory protein HupE